ncbi:MAG: proline--tRNA ligase, partial [Thermoplasmata archaeon]|nr:proline--tRNA ligase [Candidatus Sysuiplasma superficiale]
MRKSDDFSEWYNEVVEQNELTDKRYPIKGMNVWPYYGWKTWLLIGSIVRREFDLRGHQEVYFPLLIPEDQFQKEKEHIKGFDAQVFWVTRAGDNELDIPLLLRPTSETAMYPIFSVWIRSHADLPLRIYQIVNTFRYETKQTRAFIRVREIQFIEGHTCHASYEEAESQIREDLEIMKNIAEELCLPYKVIRRTEWDKFPGALYTYGVDTMLPDGRALQIASIHQYRTNFSIPYNIYFEEEDGSRKPVHQTTYGMSERMLGAVVAIHGDDTGLIIPPSVSPVQVLVVPVPVKGEAERITGEARKIYDAVSSLGFRTRFDDRDIRPGNKYYYWERRGVPLRLEIGKREIDEGFVTAVRRDS